MVVKTRSPYALTCDHHGHRCMTHFYNACLVFQSPVGESRHVDKANEYVVFKNSFIPPEDAHVQDGSQRSVV